MLTLTVDDYDTLLIALGVATGALGTHSPAAWGIVRLINCINEGNPDFTPYEIPE
jgi:hypothetical protein